MFKSLRFAIPAACAALVVAGCGSDSVPSDSVAKVGGTDITKAEFNHWLLAGAKQQAQTTGQKPQNVVLPDPPNFASCVAAKSKQAVPKGVPKPTAADLKNQCKQEYDGLRDQTLQFLISAQWLLQETKARKITASDAEVKTTFEQQKKQSFPKEADYQKFIQSSGQTEADLLYRVKLSVLTNKLQQNIIKGKGKVSDADVTTYYNKNKQRFAQPETRDLLVVLNPNKAKAAAAAKAVKGGQSWASVAKKYSTDAASKAQGGKLPNVTKGQQEKAFDTAIFSSPKGKVVGPIKTQFGYYVFQVSKVSPAKQQSLAQVKETIRNLLTSQSQQKALNDFVTKFQKDYTKKTNCAKGYVIQQCKNAPKPKSSTAPVSGAPPGGSGQQQPTPQVPGQGGAQQVPQQGAPQQGAPQQGAPSGP